MSSCDATAFTSRSRAWRDTRSSTARWTGTNSVLPKSSTGSVSTSNPLFDSSCDSSGPGGRRLKPSLPDHSITSHLKSLQTLVRKSQHRAGKFESRLLGPIILERSSPKTWVTECTGYMGNNLGPNRLSSGCPELSAEFRLGLAGEQQTEALHPSPNTPSTASHFLS